MKILMLTPYLPFPLHSGGQIRTYNLLKKLSAKHEITLYALIKDEAETQYIPALTSFCKVRVFKRSSRPFTLKNILKTGFSSFPFLVIRNHVPELRDQLAKELRDDQAYDLIHAETFYMMPHLPKTKIPILLAEQTIEYLGYESYAAKAHVLLRPFLNIDIKKLRRWEHYFWNHCQQMIVMSDEDKSYVRGFVNKNIPIDVVANGVDSDWFAAMPRHESAVPTILFVGTFRWLPNVEAVRFLVKDIWPQIIQQLPQAELHIVGAHPSPEIMGWQHEHGIQVIGNIPDIREAFTTAHVLAAPVFSGKGTRYKILEALAAGTPVLATATAVEGLGITPNKHALVRNDADTFAETLIELLQNTKLRNNLRRSGLAFVRAQFDWQLIVKELDQIYYGMRKTV